MTKFHFENPIKTKKDLLKFLELIVFIVMIYLVTSMYFQLTFNTALIAKNTDMIVKLQQQVQTLEQNTENTKAVEQNVAQ